MCIRDRQLGTIFHWNDKIDKNHFFNNDLIFFLFHDYIRNGFLSYLQKSYNKNLQKKL